MIKVGLLIRLKCVMDFAETVESAPFILTGGALIERLRRDERVRLDPQIENAALIYDPRGRAVLEGLYRQYLDIGQAYDLPMVACTPTWRASPDRLRAARFSDQDDVNGDGFQFVSAIRESYGAYAKRVHIGGLMGCAGDAYKPEVALSEDEAASYHRHQAQALSEAGVDFLMAATLPAAGEAAGIARAMTGCGLPYILSFVLRPTGTLLDGTPLHEAVVRIESGARPAPLGYMANCVHPVVFGEALSRAISLSAGVGERVIGLEANTSARSPEELDDFDHLDEADTPEALADTMLDARRRFGIKILGGCCGTDDRHIRCLAERIADSLGVRPIG
jgi:S-methylmethionine-dependent homocysteine/selenocysteine methylase